MMGEHVWRYTLLGTIFSLLAFAIVTQMARIQLNPELVKYLMDAREEYQGTYRMINPARGLIYDRYGHVMAGDTKVYEVGVELAWVENPHTIALALNVVLGLDYNSVLQATSRMLQPIQCMSSWIISYRRRRSTGWKVIGKKSKIHMGGAGIKTAPACLG